MATRYRIGTSNDYDATANWSGAAVPVDGDDVKLTSGSSDLLTNIDRSGVSAGDAPATVLVGGTFSGSIGLATGTGLKYGAITGSIEVDVNGGAGQILHFGFTSVPLVKVRRTGSNAYACYLDAGTITDLYIGGGMSVRLGAGLTVTNLYVVHEQDREVPQIYIESGCTLNGTVQCIAGVINSYAAVSAAMQLRGSTVWTQLGGTTGNISGALSVGGNAQLHMLGESYPSGFTLTAATTFENGFIDTSQSGSPVTFTNATAMGGMILTKANDVFTNTPKVVGGRIPNYGSVSVLIPGGR